MKNIGIDKPCSENWNEMTKNEQGAFCQKCASQVHDFTKKSSLEIKQTLLSFVGQPVCGRITNEQEIQLNEDFDRWINRQNSYSFQSQLLFALLVIFGLTLFSCENETKVKDIEKVQTSLSRIIKEIEEQEKTHAIEKGIAPVNDESRNYIIQGEIAEVTTIPEQKVISEPEECVKLGEIYTHIAGGISFSNDYETYLVETAVPTTEELDVNGNVIPKEFATKVFPNPAQEQTTFELALPKDGYYEIRLFDMNGKMLKLIKNGDLKKGIFREKLNLIDLKSGMYLIVINSSDFKKTVKFSKV